MAFLHVQLHCLNARQNRCQEDHNSFPLGELEETTSMPPYYIDEDYVTRSEIQNLSLNEATDVAQNRPLWRLMSTFGDAQCQWWLPEMNEWMNEL